MKTFFKIRLAAFSATLTVLFSLMVFSCQKEEMPAPETFTPPATEPVLFTKEVTITDKSGRNSAIVKFSATDEDLLEEQNASEMFKIEPLFDKPTPDGLATGSQTAPDLVERHEEETISAEVTVLHLEEGAIGWKVTFDASQPASAVSDRSHCAGFNVLYQPTFFDNIIVYTGPGNNPHNDFYWKKMTSTGSWIFLGSNYNVWTFSTRSAPGSYQMKLQVYQFCHGTHQAFGWN
jgi:hypothetical protein